MSPVHCCWHLIIMFVTAPCSYRNHSKTEHSKHIWKSMTHIDRVCPFLMALFHYKAPRPIRLLKSEFISSTWLNSFLEWGFLISMWGRESPNKRPAPSAKHDLSNCAVLPIASSWVCFIAVSLHFPTEMIMITVDDSVDSGYVAPWLLMFAAKMPQRKLCC